MPRLEWFDGYLSLLCSNLFVFRCSVYFLRDLIGKTAMISI